MHNFKAWGCLTNNIVTIYYDKHEIRYFCGSTVYRTFLYFYVQLLVEWGANIYAKNKQSRTAFDVVKSDEQKVELVGKHCPSHCEAYRVCCTD